MFHLVIFDPDRKKLWYMVANLNNIYNYAVELYKDIDFIRETVFSGVNTGMDDSSTHTLKQSYSVGYAKLLTYNNGADVLEDDDKNNNSV